MLADYYGVLLALLWLNFALMLGSGINAVVRTPLTCLHLLAACCEDPAHDRRLDEAEWARASELAGIRPVCMISDISWACF